MKKNSVAYYVVLCGSLVLTIYLFELLLGKVELGVLPLIPYAASAAIGTVSGLLYFKLFGYRVTRLQFLSVIIPTLIITVLFARSGIIPQAVFHDTSMLVALILVISKSYENNKDKLQQKVA
ncbi:hypothetical protein [Thalassotalea marina]|uniref:Uncharacterized protein n=1 Tax=Thalassotalea marina TaxID=1673741 RepID=A0A919EIU1_9GAMM|nr:hypothetical protein [Thalassotalea marina]GHF88732.1 hypothetical protein GCM10017161_15600 [Thalassotalea marina]